MIMVEGSKYACMRLLPICLNFKRRDWLPLQLMSIAWDLLEKTQLVLSIPIIERLIQTSGTLKWVQLQQNIRQQCPDMLCKSNLWWK